jgi:hypothetical protein
MLLFPSQRKDYALMEPEVIEANEWVSSKEYGPSEPQDLTPVSPLCGSDSIQGPGLFRHLGEGLPS